LYLSNYCVNRCLYCGFNRDTDAPRARLTVEEAKAEAEVLSGAGFRDVLLVSSEDRDFITVDYLARLAGGLRDSFSSIAVEVYQLTTGEYARLFAAGIEGVTIYQETYDRRLYERYHTAGPKADYDNRLDAPDRAGTAGMREIGIGVLLGLADWRIEALALAEHVHRLMKRYWKSHVSISFPRLRPAEGVEGDRFEHLPGDAELVQMITALRLCFADAGLVLSTREPAPLRDRLIELGITKVSAASRTSPGAYTGRCGDAVRQFEVDDTRSAAEVAEAIRQRGFDPVWKDWCRPEAGRGSHRA
jgi:2-iminoacetate synthase